MNQIAKTTAAPGTEPKNLLPSDPMTSMIERVAMDPNADIDKLERMLAMKERLENKAAETAFNEAKAQAQAEMPAVAARHYNDQTKSKFAKLKDIYDACKPILAKHGFSFSAVPVVGGRDNYINMRWTLSRAGHSISDVSEIPIDDRGMKGTANKTQTHAYGSTTSYGRRYLFCSVFDIAVGEDDDGNGSTTHQPINDDQFNALFNKLEESGMDPKKFHLAFGHKDPENADLRQFPAARYDEAISRLTKFMEAQKNG